MDALGKTCAISPPYLLPVVAGWFMLEMACLQLILSLSVFLQGVRSVDSETVPLPCVVFLPSGLI